MFSVGRIGFGLCLSGGLLPVIAAADFSALDLSTSSNGAALTSAVAALGATYTCATASTVQTSSSAFVSGIAADVPRLGNFGSGRGLVHERAITNAIAQPRDMSGAGWIAGFAHTSNFAAGADGTAAIAERCNFNGGTYSYSITLNSVPTDTVGSCFARANTGTANHVMFLGSNSLGTTSFAQNTLGTTYQRVFATCKFLGNVGYHPVDTLNNTAIGGPAAAAQDVIVDAHQLETGKRYPGEYTDTTCAGTRLRVSNAVDGGRLGMYVRFIPKGTYFYSDNEYYGAVRLWTVDASNYCEADSATGAISVVVAGSTFLAGSIALVRGSVVEMFVEAGGGSLTTRVYVRLNGGSWIKLGESTAAQGTVPNTAVDVLSNGTGSHWDCLLQEYRFYAAGERPVTDATTPPLVILDGNSLTNSFGCKRLTYRDAVRAALSQTCVMRTDGVNSTSTPAVTTQAATTVFPYATSVGAKRVVVMWEGTNAIYNGASAATAYADLVSYCAAARAAGFLVVIATILPRTQPGTPAGFEAARTTVNANIVANWATFADALADVAANTTIGENGDSDNTTYYSDKVHLTEAGHAIVGPIIAAAVNTLL